MTAAIKTGLKVATRGSALALIQAKWVKERLKILRPEMEVSLLVVKTRGDKILNMPLATVGGKGLFVKEIEETLLNGEADIAVHSMKDLPAEIPDGLIIAAIPEREDCRDALVSRRGEGFDRLPEGARIGTSSLRRRAQLLHRRPDFEVTPLRGNVDTRLKKLEEEGLDAIVLAAAGLIRLNLLERADEILEPEVMLPAVGQGALGIEARTRDTELLGVLALLHHEPTALVVRAERAFLAALEGSCQVPIAALGQYDRERFSLTGLVSDLEGRRYFRQSLAGNPDEPELLGGTLADILLSRGAGPVLSELSQASK